MNNNIFFAIVLCISILSLVASVIAIMQNCNNKSNYISIKSSSQFKRPPPGPISVEFFLASNSDGTVGRTTNIEKFIINNNGDGYLSLMDLFYAPEIKNGPSTLHAKIKMLLKKSSTLSDKTYKTYFSQSVYMTCGKDQGLKPIISIASFSFIFGKGQAYVQSLLSEKGIGTAEIGDAWGAPLFLELGGQRYNTPNSNIPITSTLYKQGGTPPTDYSKFFTPNAYSNRLTVDIGGTPYPVCFGNIRIHGSGQTSSVIRGSCVLVLYDVKDFSTVIGIDTWPDRALTPAAATGRIQCSGFFWTGHFGISTDYNMLLPQSTGTASAPSSSVPSNPTDYQPTTLKIGTSPTHLLGNAPSVCRPAGDGGPQPTCLPLYVPRYTTLVPHTKQAEHCPYQNSQKRCPYENMGMISSSISCGMAGFGGKDPLTNKSIEFLCIDIWIELQPMQTQECQDINCTLLGYPLFFVNIVCGKRFFLSNCNFFSYQTMNRECAGLVYLGNSFTKLVAPFGAPTDTFVQQCAFAAKTLPTSKNVLNPALNLTTISLLVENGDKVSIVNSTFHGQCHVNSNKLAMFNCYCLSVGVPRVNNYIRMVEPGVVFSVPKNAKLASGYAGLPTSSRLIFQNMIFVVHVDGDEMKGLQSTNPIQTLNDLKTYNYFDVNNKPDNSYLTTDVNKNVFPFWIDTTGISLKSASSATPEKFTNVFLKDVAYYGVFIYKDTDPSNPGPPPTFSAINLTNISTAFVNNLTPGDQNYGNSL